MRKINVSFSFLLVLILFAGNNGYSQQARARWEKMNQIRKDKFDIILPQVMRENQIDMWITVVKDGHYDPLCQYFGDGFGSSIEVSTFGFIIFTDRGGDRIERAVFGISGYEIRNCGAYDIFGPDPVDTKFSLVGPTFDLKKFVAERNPKRIGINMSVELGGADGISYTEYQYLVKTLGEPYSSRLVSAEKLISDFLHRRVPSEIVAFGEAGQITREIEERALSNEVITPGVTTLEDVAWWARDQLETRRLEASFGLGTIMIYGPNGVRLASTDSRIIQRGDVLNIDWGVKMGPFYTDVKRQAYVLKEGETKIPAGIQNAFQQALVVREVFCKNVKSGRTGAETLETANHKLEEAGFGIMKTPHDVPAETNKTEVHSCCHSTGSQTAHSIGPSLAYFQPQQLQFKIYPTTFLAIELFVYPPVPEWGGKKIRIALEDDAMITDRGVEWLYPINNKMLVIK